MSSPHQGQKTDVYSSPHKSPDGVVLTSQSHQMVLCYPTTPVTIWCDAYPHQRKSSDSEALISRHKSHLTMMHDHQQRPHLIIVVRRPRVVGDSGDGLGGHLRTTTAAQNTAQRTALLLTVHQLYLHRQVTGGPWRAQQVWSTPHRHWCKRPLENWETNLLFDDVLQNFNKREKKKNHLSPLNEYVLDCSI